METIRCVAAVRAAAASRDGSEASDQMQVQTAFTAEKRTNRGSARLHLKHMLFV